MGHYGIYSRCCVNYTKQGWHIIAHYGRLLRCSSDYKSEVSMAICGKHINTNQVCA